MDNFGEIYLNEEELAIYGDPFIKAEDRFQRHIDYIQNAGRRGPDHKEIRVFADIFWALNHFEETTALAMFLFLSKGTASLKADSFYAEAPKLVSSWYSEDSWLRYSADYRCGSDDPEIDILFRLFEELDSMERSRVMTSLDDNDILKLNFDYRYWVLTQEDIASRSRFFNFLSNYES